MPAVQHSLSGALHSPAGWLAGVEGGRWRESVPMVYEVGGLT